LLAVIPVSTKIQRISISKDDGRVFTADQASPRVAVIDTGTRQVTTWIPLPAPGYGTTPTPDGRLLLVAMQSLSQVAVIDLKAMKVVRVIDLPKSPHEILVTPDGATAYVSCSASGEVAAVRIADWTVTGMIDAGKYVDGLAWVPSAP
jgi:YVTN family beta-propeller protein